MADRLRLAVVRGIVCASGAAALLFETLWFREAGLALGNTVWASSLVLAAFMAGLALGSGAAARWGGRLRRPLLAYARLEAAIGVAGGGLVFLFPLLTRLLAPGLGRLAASPTLLGGMRFGTAFALLLAPATAMGATLPLLVRALEANDSSFGRRLGWLYGWNTLGAVAGSVAGEVALIEACGVRGTALVAALLDVAAALAAAALARDSDSPSRAPAASGARRLDGRARWLLAAASLAGALLLSLEVVWFRFLALFVDGTSLAFGIMLAVVLAGIGLGGLAASWWLRWRPRADAFLPAIALFAGLATALTYIRFVDVLRPYRGAVLYGWDEILTVSLQLMLPVCLASGILFPLLGKALREEVDDDAGAAGLLTLANTLGAMGGALVGGFVLLPHLGVEKALALQATAYGLVALATLRSSAGRERARGAGLALAAVGIPFVAVLVLFPFGLMANHYLRRAAGAWMGDGARIEAMREGLTETVIYLRKDFFDEPLYHRLVTNSLSMSGTQFNGARYMRLFVWWAVAVRPEPKHALLISYGVGSTAEALTDTPSLTSIDVVDPSADILDLSRLVFPTPRRRPLDDPRVTVHVEDARFFLLTTGRRFDLITGEPPPPRSAGIVNLYSQEYFALLRDRLADGGVATYWLPVNQLAPDEARSITAAFCGVFEDCSLWAGFGADWMLAGTRGGTGPPSEEAFARQWSDPAAGPALRGLGVESPEQLGALFIADADQLAAWTRGIPPLDDDRPYRLSFRRPRGNLAFFLDYSDPARTRERFLSSAFVRGHWPPGLLTKTLAAFDWQRVVHRFSWALYADRSVSPLPDVDRLLTSSPLRTLPLWLLGSSTAEDAIATRAAARGVSDPLLDHYLGISALAARDFAAAERHLHRAQTGLGNQEPIAEGRVLALCLAGDRAGAARLMDETRAWLEPSDRHGWAWLATRCRVGDP